MRLRRLLFATLLAVGTLPLFGASCDKKSAAEPVQPEAPAVVTTGAAAGAEPAAGGAKAGKPRVLEGVDDAGLDDAARARLGKLADKLPSPCGKAHSLRRSLAAESACARAPFAGRYVVRLLKVELSDEEIAVAYGDRYAARPAVAVPVDAAPFEGHPRAAVRIVEFFDYGCPHCRLMRPVLDEVVARYPADVVVHFKHYPLGARAESVQAAMAAVSAQRQGKFREFHKLLLDAQEDLSRPALLKHARAARLDEQRTAADLDDARVRERVLSDKADGERAGLQGTPTLYVNGRLYSDPNTTEMISDWVEEELAVKR